jgi:Zn-dependent M28 family amino/carboxypeptidase
VLALFVIPFIGLGVRISQPLFSAGELSTVTVAPEVLKEHVRKLSVDFAPRSYRNKSNLTLCADYIREHFTEAGAAVSSQPYIASSATYENIIARFGPESGKRVVVGAHYDACDSTPGADDNASGVAGLLELARLIGAESSPPALRLELVAYCTEEPPHFAGANMGSFQHAQSLATEHVDVSAMLCLEMIGYFTDAPSSQTYPMPVLKLIYPSTGNYIGIVGNTEQRDLLAAVKHAMSGATDLPVYSAAVPTLVPGVDFSDHRSYWQFKYRRS